MLRAVHNCKNVRLRECLVERQSSREGSGVRRKFPTGGQSFSSQSCDVTNQP